MTLIHLMEEHMTQRVLFVCPHGVAKSVMAKAAFAELAAEKGLDVVAMAAGAAPDAAVWPSVVDLLRESGIDVAGEQPRALSQTDIEASSRVVTLGCDLAPFDLGGKTVETWDDLPLASEDLRGAWAAIRVHVAQLVAEIEERREVG
jgi:arsenate reductase (thioredoxin)